MTAAVGRLGIAPASQKVTPASSFGPPDPPGLQRISPRVDAPQADEHRHHHPQRERRAGVRPLRGAHQRARSSAPARRVGSSQRTTASSPATRPTIAQAERQRERADDGRRRGEQRGAEATPESIPVRQRDDVLAEQRRPAAPTSRSTPGEAIAVPIDGGDDAQRERDEREHDARQQLGREDAPAVGHEGEGHHAGPLRPLRGRRAGSRRSAAGCSRARRRSRASRAASGPWRGRRGRRPRPRRWSARRRRAAARSPRACRSSCAARRRSAARGPGARRRARGGTVSGVSGNGRGAHAASSAVSWKYRLSRPAPSAGPRWVRATPPSSAARPTASGKASTT